MLLTMAGLMVAIVWLSAHAQERTLPPIELPTSQAGSLGLREDTPLRVTLRPETSARGASADTARVFVEERELPGGIPQLETELEGRRGGTLTLRADAGLRWETVLEAMSAAAKWDISVNVAVER